jgi:hypothetical protein
MAFLTKPTHDLVSIIEKIRNPQDAAAWGCHNNYKYRHCLTSKLSAPG